MLKRSPSSVGVLSPQKLALVKKKLLDRGVAQQGGERIPRRVDDGPAPLSFNQEGLWFIEAVDPGKPTYNIPAPVRLRGKLDIGALEKSLGEILRRHEALRVSFRMSDDGMPRQAVDPPSPFLLNVEDLGDWPRKAVEAEIVKRAEEDGSTPFDLSNGPLFSASLLRVADDEHVLLMKVHHLVIDGWSWGILTRELKELYPAFARGDPSPLPEPELQYSDFAVWQREWLTGAVYERLVSYWREQLRDAPVEIALPVDRPRPGVQTFRGGHLALRVTSTLSHELRDFSRREGNTLFVTLMSAFGVLLGHYSSEEDVLVGSTFANRDRPELETVVGYFVTLLPIRMRLRGTRTFRELLAQVSETTAGAAAHQSVPLGHLVKELGYQRDVSRNPVVQVVFYVLTPDHNPAMYGFGLPGVGESSNLGDLRVTPIETECGLARFDIMVLLWDLPDGLSGTVEYNRDLFDHSTIERVMASYELLLRRIVGEPEADVESLIEWLNAEDERRDQLRRRSARHDVELSLRRLRGLGQGLGQSAGESLPRDSSAMTVDDD